MEREQVLKSLEKENFTYDEYVTIVTAFTGNDASANDIMCLLKVALERRSEALIDAVSTVLGRKHSFVEFANGGDLAAADQLVNLLTEILSQTWHGAHEDFVAELEAFPSLKTIEALRQMVDLKPPILAQVDNANGLCRKVIWGLGKIAYPLDHKMIDSIVRIAAVNALIDLLRHPDPAVIEWAEKQLHRAFSVPQLLSFSDI